MLDEADDDVVVEWDIFLMLNLSIPERSAERRGENLDPNCQRDFLSVLPTLLLGEVAAVVKLLDVGEEASEAVDSLRPESPLRRCAGSGKDCARVGIKCHSKTV